MICAIYCRLSKEDAEKTGAESESIQNQKALLCDYAHKEGWQIYKIYVDEDYSGIDSHRPQFLQLLQDAQKKCFHVVLCKSQSRFTRDMELVERYIHHKFVLWGIRFVTVIDNADSNIKSNKKARQINGLINEWYLEDLSDNIKAVLDHKRRNGQYIASFPLYGYQKDPADHHRLLVDEEAATVVKKIYAFYMAGNGQKRIAELLNQEGIANPSRYKRQKGMAIGLADGGGLWNKNTVGRILKNEMYIGTLVQGIKRKLSYKSHRSICPPPQEWIRVPDHHQPIIERETFLLVQQMLAGCRRADGRGQVHFLAGKVYCAHCGQALAKNTNGQGYAYLSCRACHNYVRLDDMTQLVKEQIKEHIEQFYQLPDLGKWFLDTDRYRRLSKQMKNTERERDKYTLALKDLYIDQAAGVFLPEEFIDLRQHLLKEKNSLGDRLRQLQASLAAGDADMWQRKARNLLGCEYMERDLLHLFIDKIKVGKNEQDSGKDIVIDWLI